MECQLDFSEYNEAFGFNISYEQIYYYTPLAEQGKQSSLIILTLSKFVTCCLPFQL